MMAPSSGAAGYYLHWYDPKPQGASNKKFDSEAEVVQAVQAVLPNARFTNWIELPPPSVGTFCCVWNPEVAAFEVPAAVINRLPPERPSPLDLGDAQLQPATISGR